MNAKQVTEKLISVLNEDAAQEILRVSGLRSFEAAGVKTRDDGFVIRLPDGSEFQVTVAKRR